MGESIKRNEIGGRCRDCKNYCELFSYRLKAKIPSCKKTGDEPCKFVRRESKDEV